MKTLKVRGFEAKFADQMAEKIQRFLNGENISREDIVSITLTSAPDCCRCILVYEQEQPVASESK